MRIVWGSWLKCRLSGRARRDADLVGIYILISNTRWFYPLLLRDHLETTCCPWRWQHWHAHIHGSCCLLFSKPHPWCSKYPWQIGSFFSSSMPDSFSRLALSNKQWLSARDSRLMSFIPSWRQSQGRVLASFQMEPTALNPFFLHSDIGAENFPLTLTSWLFLDNRT